MELTSKSPLDIWVDSTPENAERAYRALVEFGAPMADLTGTHRVDVMTMIDA